MNYLFQVYGRVVEVYRFRVDYKEHPNESDEMKAVHAVCYCNAQEEADAVAAQTGGTITALDTAAYEWMDGMEVADVPDTYAAAVEIYEMGREAWERKAAFEESKKADQLRADLDYVMLMGGL